MGWLSLGKRRTDYGKCVDSNGISQMDIEEESGLNKNTISRLCNDRSYKPKRETGVRAIKPLKKRGKNVKYEDFWG